MIQRILAAILSLCLVATSVPLEAVPSDPLASLTPSSRIGYVIDHFGGQPKVILIQDLHAHYGAQKNIVKLLEFLSSRLSSPSAPIGDPSFSLAVEGAEGPIDLSALTGTVAGLPEGLSPALRNEALDYLMREGELTGMEYFAITHNQPNLLQGVEDFRYYNTHRELFRKTYEQREKLVLRLTAIQRDLADLRPKVYSPELLALIKKDGAIWEESQEITHFMQKLELAKTPEAKALLQVERDLALLLKIADLRAMEREVRAFGPRLNQFIVMTERLLAVSPAEAGAQNNRLDTGLRRYDDIRELINTSVDYYALAMMRNEPMVEKTLGLLMAKREEGGVKRDTANHPSSLLPPRPASVVVLVAGGFHTAPITQLLKKRGISYMVITPAIDHMTSADHERYIKRLRGIHLTDDEVVVAARSVRRPVMRIARRLSELTSLKGNTLTIGFNFIEQQLRAVTLYIGIQSSRKLSDAWTFDTEELQRLGTVLKWGGWLSVLASLVLGILGWLPHSFSAWHVAYFGGVAVVISGTITSLLKRMLEERSGLYKFQDDAFDTPGDLPDRYGLLKPFAAATPLTTRRYLRSVIAKVDQGQLFIDKDWMRRIPVLGQLLIYLHEKTHLVLHVNTNKKSSRFRVLMEWFANMPIIIILATPYVLPWLFLSVMTVLSPGWVIALSFIGSLLLSLWLRNVPKRWTVGGYDRISVENFREQLLSVHRKSLLGDPEQLDEAFQDVNESIRRLHAHIFQRVKDLRSVPLRQKEVLHIPLRFDAPMQGQPLYSVIGESIIKAAAITNDGERYMAAMMLGTLMAYHDVILYAQQKARREGIDREKPLDIYDSLVVPYQRKGLPVFLLPQKPTVPQLFRLQLKKARDQYAASPPFLGWLALAFGLLYIILSPLSWVLTFHQSRKFRAFVTTNQALYAEFIEALLAQNEDLPKDVLRYLADPSRKSHEDEEVGSRRFHALIEFLTLKRYGYPMLTIGSESKVLLSGPGIPTIGLLGHLQEDELAIAAEGARQGKANFLIVSSFEDISLRKSGGKTVVYARAGLIFHEGRPMFTRFQTPIPLHYIADFLPPNKNLSKRLIKAGVPLAGHSMVDDYTEEKDITTAILAESGIRVPLTHSIIVSNNKHKSFVRRRKDSKHVTLISKTSSNPLAMMTEQLRTFLSQTTHKQAVIKPNRGHGGEGVVFVSPSTIEEAAQKMVEMMSCRENISLQERILPPWIESGAQMMDWNLRVFIARDPDGRLKVSDIVVRIDREGQAINISKGAGVLSMPELQKQLGVNDETFRALEEEIGWASIAAYEAVERAMIQDGVIKEGESSTDFMGADVIVARENGRLVPYVLEVNDYHSGGMWDLDNHILRAAPGVPMDPSRIGQSSRDWVDTMTTKAIQYKARLRGKVPVTLEKPDASDGTGQGGTPASMMFWVFHALRVAGFPWIKNWSDERIAFLGKVWAPIEAFGAVAAIGFALPITPVLIVFAGVVALGHWVPMAYLAIKKSPRAPPVTWETAAVPVVAFAIYSFLAVIGVHPQQFLDPLTALLGSFALGHSIFDWLQINFAAELSMRAKERISYQVPQDVMKFAPEAVRVALRRLLEEEDPAQMPEVFQNELKEFERQVDRFEFLKALSWIEGWPNLANVVLTALLDDLETLEKRRSSILISTLFEDPENRCLELFIHILPNADEGPIHSVIQKLLLFEKQGDPEIIKLGEMFTQALLRRVIKGKEKARDIQALTTLKVIGVSYQRLFNYFEGKNHPQAWFVANLYEFLGELEMSKVDILMRTSTPAGAVLDDKPAAENSHLITMAFNRHATELRRRLSAATDPYTRRHYLDLLIEISDSYTEILGMISAVNAATVYLNEENREEREKLLVQQQIKFGLLPDLPAQKGGAPASIILSILDALITAGILKEAEWPVERRMKWERIGMRVEQGLGVGISVASYANPMLAWIPVIFAGMHWVPQRYTAFKQGRAPPLRAFAKQLVVLGLYGLPGLLSFASNLPFESVLPIALALIAAWNHSRYDNKIFNRMSPSKGKKATTSRMESRRNFLETVAAGVGAGAVILTGAAGTGNVAAAQVQPGQPSDTFEKIFKDAGGLDRFVAAHPELANALRKRLSASPEQRRRYAQAYVLYCVLQDGGLAGFRLSKSGRDFETRFGEWAMRYAKQLSWSDYLLGFALGWAAIIRKTIDQASRALSQDLQKPHDPLRQFLQNPTPSSPLTPLSAYAILGAQLHGRGTGRTGEITLVMERDKRLLLKMNLAGQAPLYVYLDEGKSTFDLPAQEARELTPAALEDYDLAQPYVGVVDPSRGVEQISDRKLRGLMKDALPALTDLSFLKAAAPVFEDVLLRPYASLFAFSVNDQRQLCALIRLHNYLGRRSEEFEALAICDIELDWFPSVSKEEAASRKNLESYLENIPGVDWIALRTTHNIEKLDAWLKSPDVKRLKALLEADPKDTAGKGKEFISRFNELSAISQRLQRASQEKDFWKKLQQRRNKRFITNASVTPSPASPEAIGPTRFGPQNRLLMRMDDRDDAPRTPAPSEASIVVQGDVVAFLSSLPHMSQKGKKATTSPSGLLLGLWWLATFRGDLGWDLMSRTLRHGVARVRSSMPSWLSKPPDGRTELERRRAFLERRGFEGISVEGDPYLSLNDWKFAATYQAVLPQVREELEKSDARYQILRDSRLFGSWRARVYLEKAVIASVNEVLAEDNEQWLHRPGQIVRDISLAVAGDPSRGGWPLGEWAVTLYGKLPKLGRRSLEDERRSILGAA